MNVPAVANLPALINESHRLALASAKTAVEHAIRCGQLLLEQKASLPHGQFQQWVKTYCEFEASTARRYMLAAKQNATGVAISSLSGLFPSGSKVRIGKDASTDAPESQAVLNDNAVADPSVRVKRGSNVPASWVTTSLIDGIAEAVDNYKDLSAQYEAVEMLTGFPRESAVEYAPLLADILKRIGRLHRRLAAIAKEGQP